MPWLIYKHTNKINGKVYIGQTCKKNVNERWRNGLGYKRYNERIDQSIFEKAIKKYGWHNFTHEIIENDIESQEQANVREIYWIKYYNSYIGFKDSNGYNMTLGGDSREHISRSVIQISKNNKEVIGEFSNCYEASYFLIGSNGIASQIRRCCNGEKVSCKGFLWCYKENYTSNWKPKNNDLLSPVYQLNDDYEVIRRYDSITDASKENNFSRGSIMCCCQRKQRKANNYYWCYEKDYSLEWEPVTTSFIRNRKVCCVETGIVYNNSKEASKQTSVNYGHLKRVCEGKECVAGGYHWKYVD